MEIHLFGDSKFHILTDKEFIFRNGLLKEHTLYLCTDRGCSWLRSYYLLKG